MCFSSSITVILFKGSTEPIPSSDITTTATVTDEIFTTAPPHSTTDISTTDSTSTVSTDTTTHSTLISVIVEPVASAAINGTDDIPSCKFPPNVVVPIVVVLITLLLMESTILLVIVVCCTKSKRSLHKMTVLTNSSAKVTTVGYQRTHDFDMPIRVPDEDITADTFAMSNHVSKEVSKEKESGKETEKVSSSKLLHVNIKSY